MEVPASSESGLRVSKPRKPAWLRRQGKGCPFALHSGKAVTGSNFLPRGTQGGQEASRYSQRQIVGGLRRLLFHSWTPGP